MDWQKKVSLWWAKNFRPLVVALLDRKSTR